MTTRKDYNGLVRPDQSVLVLIDHQPQFAFGVSSIDRRSLLANVIALARGAKAFQVPVVVTFAKTDSLNGDIWPQLRAVLPDAALVARSTINPWEEAAFSEAIGETKRSRIVLAGLWTEGALSLAALSTVEEGYEAYVVKDASGGTTIQDHETSMDRMVQAGAVPMTVRQLLLEWQRDWSKSDTLKELLDVAGQHGGEFGAGVETS